MSNVDTFKETLKQKDHIISSLREELEQESKLREKLQKELIYVMELFMKEHHSRIRHSTMNHSISSEESKHFESLKETNIVTDAVDELDMEGNRANASKKLNNHIHGRWRKTGITLSVINAMRTPKTEVALEQMTL